VAAVGGLWQWHAIGVTAPIGVIAGVAVGVLLLVAALAVALVVSRRRMQAQQKKLIEEYSAQLQTLTMQRGAAGALFASGMTSDAAMLKANLQVPKTSFAGTDATLLNTIMEVALPGFLRLDHGQDLHVDARMTAGGAGTVFRGTLRNTEAIARNGTDVCAIKEVRACVYTRFCLRTMMPRVVCCLVCVCVGMFVCVHVPVHVCLAGPCWSHLGPVLLFICATMWGRWRIGRRSRRTTIWTAFIARWQLCGRWRSTPTSSG
jgi:hypothetical protein